MMKAYMQCRRITDVPLDKLYAVGCRAVLLDLDNTLAPWRVEEVDPAIDAWLRQAEAQGIRLCMLSNSTSARAHRMQQRLKIPYGIFKAGKPFGSGYHRAMELLGVTREQTVMIGDQICTDLIGAKVRGIRCVLLDPIDPHEMRGTYVLRWIERVIFRRKKL